MYITVLMSVYDEKPEYLSQAIKSILEQTFSDFEFLIVDDCSSKEEIRNLLEEFAKDDNRIKLLRNTTNMGLTASLNKGIEFSKGKYIARMDSDDIAERNRLKKQYQFMEENEGIAVSGSFAVFVDENNQVVGSRRMPISSEEIKKKIVFRNPIIHPSAFMRKRVLRCIGQYDPRFRKIQDYDLWFRLIKAGYNIANIPEFLLRYRLTKETALKKRNANYRRAELKIRWEHVAKGQFGIRGYMGLTLPIFQIIVPKTIQYQFYRWFAERAHDETVG